jgi:hypothetical protein
VDAATRYASDEPLGVSVEEQYARHSHRAIHIRTLDVRAHTSDRQVTRAADSSHIGHVRDERPRRISPRARRARALCRYRPSAARVPER